MRPLRFVLVLSCLAWCFQSAAKASIVIPEDTRVKLRLADAHVTTENAVKGNLVNFKAANDVSVNGTLIVAKDSPAIGIITEVQRPLSGSHEMLVISLQSVRGADGSLVRLKGKVTDPVSNRGVIGTSRIALEHGSTVRSRIPKGTVFPSVYRFDSATSKIVIPEDVGVSLRLTDTGLSTLTADAGDIVLFETVNDVRANGVLIAAKGSPATGVVTRVQQPPGINAELEIMLKSVRGADGGLVPLLGVVRDPVGRGIIGAKLVFDGHIVLERGAIVQAVISKNTIIPKGSP